MDDSALDEVDMGILLALQRDARNTTNVEIAKEVDVSASTVRNRIEQMESAGVIEGYYPKINYGRANFPLRVLFICEAPLQQRAELAQNALDTRGVLDVRETMNSNWNVYVEVVATTTQDLGEIADDLSKLGFDDVSSAIVTNHYVRPWTEFEFDYSA